MNGILRPVVAGAAAARFRPDAVTESVEMDHGGSADGDRIEVVAQSELREFPYRMRLQIDADAQRGKPWNPIDDGAFHPGGVQAQSGGETADPGSDDDD